MRPTQSKGPLEAESASAGRSALSPAYVRKLFARYPVSRLLRFLSCGIES